MIRKSIFLLFFGLSALALRSQVLNPVTWSFGNEKTGEKTYELTFIATIEESWHLYAIDIPEGGPVATGFTIEAGPGFNLTGKPFQITKPEVKFDGNFNMNIGMFSHQAEFRQKITVTKLPVTVKGYVTFMSCDDNQCLPPRDEEFAVEIKETGGAVKEAVNPISDQPDNSSGQEAGTSAENNQLTGPVEQSTVISSDTTSQTDNTGKENNSGKGWLRFFLLSMLAGLAGVLTPCVFPMIPMTVGFFSQGSENKGASILKALVFGISIIILYSSLGIIVSLTSAGAGLANTLSTHWIPNLLFFVLFLVFAASFFGAFEIVLPSKWVSSSDSKVDKGGVLASAFLGLTTVLVSFSCTGPIVGALLVEAASGDVLRPTIGMFGFGLAFALPFTLFALFPSWMKKMPKSGGWLNSIKVVLGFIMLAFSLKFASVIDNVYSLGILSRDIYLAIWIVIFGLLGLYLMGKIKFAHDSDVKNIGTFRLLLIIASFSFAVYLVPGLFGAPLKGISSLLPPGESSGFNLLKAIGENRGNAAVDPTTPSVCETPRYAGFLHFEHGLKGYFDLDQALACAKKLNKPVLIDFKGHACANCKEMDARVWSDPEVLKRIRENFVLAGLYADDRTKLPDSEVFISRIDGKEKKTIGKKNEDIEITMFNTNTLPLYAIVDPNGKPLVETRGADFDIAAYIDWLDRGFNAWPANTPLPLGEN